MDDATLVEGCPLDEGTLSPDSFLLSLSFPAKVLAINCLLPSSFSPLSRKVVLWMKELFVEGCPLDGGTLLSDSFLLSLSFSPLLRKVVLWMKELSWKGGRLSSAKVLVIDCLLPSSFSPLSRKVVLWMKELLWKVVL